MSGWRELAPWLVEGNGTRLSVALVPRVAPDITHGFSLLEWAL